MSLFFAELRKVWGGRVFPALLAILAAANLLLLWMGTRPTAKQPPASAYRAVGAELSDKTMEEKGTYLHDKYTEIESLVKIGQYYREQAYGGYGLTQYRQDNAAMFDAYEQEYTDKTYTLFTDNLNTEYRLFSQLQSEYDTVAAYSDFLDSVQTKASQLSGISIFQNDRTGYDLKNIELTAQVYAGLTETPIDYYPQKGLYTAISYAFTDLILLASMLLLALILVRQERDSGLLSLIRSLPGGRLKTAIAKLAAFAASLLVVLMVLYGVNLAYCSASFSLGPMNRTIQSVPALMRCTMQITVGQYLLRFLLAKWAGAFVMGLWVMLAALIAKRAAAGWIGALALPLAMYGIRAAIPATSHLNVIKYANMVSLLQINELLGNYRNLFWFGSPISLPMVEWVTAAALGSILSVAFCTVFAKAQLLPAAKRSLALPFRHKTHATSVTREEGRKLLLMNGAAVFLAAFLAFGIYQGVTAESYIDADEIYYAYYMKHISGPWSEESRDWLKEQRNEFAPMLEAQKRVNRGELSSEALLAYNSLQQKYSAYQRVLQSNISYYLKENPGAWLVYETGYKKLFGFTGTSDVQDTLLAGLLCALCFSGLFAMERKGGMDEILASTPLGRKYTVKAKLRQSTAVASVIAFGTVLPHLWQVLRDYGLPSLLGPAMSISDLQAVPKFITLSDLLLFWLICRFAACLCMSRITLWLGQKLGNLLPALFISAVSYCLPALLSLSGMRNGIEWLGFYPLFHAVALWQNQGYTADGESYNAMWIPIFLVCAAFFLAWAIALREQYIQEKTDSLHKEYVNSLITSVKKELSVRSSTTAVPDIDLYQILMNQHKVQVFHDVVKMIKKPRVIQAQNLYSYRVVAQSSPFSGALAMQKVSRSKTVFSDAFKEYNDPYKFLQVLKGKDIPASEYYKYFVNITYEVFNQYGSPASGGERSEYNLLQELSDGVKNSILILDEPESSFDNIFLRDGVDSLLKDISKTIPVIIATHNNTIGVSVHPDYIVYACKEVLSDGKLEYHLYSGYPSSEDLVDLKGNHISRKSVLLDCLEAGEAAYMDRRNSYEILNG